MNQISELQSQTYTFTYVSISLFDLMHIHPQHPRARRARAPRPHERAAVPGKVQKRVVPHVRRVVRVRVVHEPPALAICPEVVRAVLEIDLTICAACPAPRGWTCGRWTAAP